jgi:DNA polymerase V
MGIHGRQLVAELNGLSCYPLEREEKPRQSIARTRTFGEDTNDAGAIEAALASFAARAAYRLRESGQVARRLGVFAQTNKHKPGARSWSRETCLNVPTADTGRLISAAVQLFQSFYNPMVKYHRAGVYLWDFLPSSALQTDILGELDPIKEDRSIRRMDAIDDINQRFGRHTVYYASENLGNTWRPKHDSRSPRYVSSWDELVNVNL